MSAHGSHLGSEHPQSMSRMGRARPRSSFTASPIRDSRSELKDELDGDARQSHAGVSGPVAHHTPHTARGRDYFGRGDGGAGSGGARVGQQPVGRNAPAAARTALRAGRSAVPAVQFLEGKLRQLLGQLKAAEGRAMVAEGKATALQAELDECKRSAQVAEATTATQLASSEAAAEAHATAVAIDGMEYDESAAREVHAALEASEEANDRLQRANSELLGRCNTLQSRLRELTTSHTLLKQRHARCAEVGLVADDASDTDTGGGGVSDLSASRLSRRSASFRSPRTPASDTKLLDMQRNLTLARSQLKVCQRRRVAAEKKVEALEKGAKAKEVEVVSLQQRLNALRTRNDQLSARVVMLERRLLKSKGESSRLPEVERELSVTRNALAIAKHDRSEGSGYVPASEVVGLVSRNKQLERRLSSLSDMHSKMIASLVPAVPMRRPRSPGMLSGGTRSPGLSAPAADPAGAADDDDTDSDYSGGADLVRVSDAPGRGLLPGGVTQVTATGVPSAASDRSPDLLPGGVTPVEPRSPRLRGSRGERQPSSASGASARAERGPRGDATTSPPAPAAAPASPLERTPPRAVPAPLDGPTPIRFEASYTEDMNQWRSELREWRMARADGAAGGGDGEDDGGGAAEVGSGSSGDAAGVGRGGESAGAPQDLGTLRMSDLRTSGAHPPPLPPPMQLSPEQMAERDTLVERKSRVFDGALRATQHALESSFNQGDESSVGDSDGVDAAAASEPDDAASTDRLPTPTPEPAEVPDDAAGADYRPVRPKSGTRFDF